MAKRLYRIRAYNPQGHEVYKRDYQTRKSAADRAAALLAAGLQAMDGEGQVYLVHNVAEVTLQVSDIVQWPSEAAIFPR